MSSSPDPEIFEQIRAILRRDLKLAADESLPADMPFFGGNLDLDSLDMLLVMTSVEKQFGAKITSHEQGKEIFQTIASLARYVQDRGQKPVNWLAKLPHGPEFRFVSRVIEVKPGESARGVWNVSGSEMFFAGHFPGSPIVPGVLIAEALAQISGLAGVGGKGMLAHLDIRFEQPISPPAEIELIAKMARLLGDLQMFDVTAQAAGQIVARGAVTLHRPGSS